MKSLRIFSGQAVTSERHPGLGTDTLDYALYEEVRLSMSLSHTISVFLSILRVREFPLLSS